MRYVQERLGWPPDGIARCNAPRPEQNPRLNTPKAGECRCVKRGGAPRQNPGTPPAEIKNRSWTERRQPFVKPHTEQRPQQFGKQHYGSQKYDGLGTLNGYTVQDFTPPPCATSP